MDILFFMIIAILLIGFIIIILVKITKCDHTFTALGDSSQKLQSKYCTTCGKIVTEPCPHDYEIKKTLSYSYGTDYLLICKNCGHSFTESFTTLH
jgi:hypothetical protein